MKKIMMTMLLLLAGLAVSAQVTLTESGVYEKKEVVVVEGVTAAELYNRAIEALSDWAGAEGRSKYGIDSQDKDAGMIIYKGKDYLGFRKFSIYGWYIYTDFTLKIRCKDGRAQVTVTIPSLTAEFQVNNVSGSVPLAEITPEWKYKGNLNCKKAMLQYVNDVPASADRMIGTIKKKLKEGAEDF